MRLKLKLTVASLKIFIRQREAIIWTLLLPVFMIWIYTCWVIVLAGMEIVWFLHNTASAVSPPGLGPDGDAGQQMHSQQGLPRD